ncbi:MAG: helix-turn-helix domain-containing protein [Chloroflexi bacterium]|nr:helix-turn-helix domain-containing protein [Chloroflexota bacterium]
MELMRRKELAKKLAVSERTLSRLESDGLPFFRVGNQMRYEWEEVEAWLKGRPESTEAPKASE